MALVSESFYKESISKKINFLFSVLGRGGDGDFFTSNRNLRISFLFFFFFFFGGGGGGWNGMEGVVWRGGSVAMVS